MRNKEELMTFWQYLKKSLAQELAHKLVWGLIIVVTIGPLMYYGGSHGIGWYRSFKEKAQATRESVKHKIDAAKDAAHKASDAAKDAGSAAVTAVKDAAHTASEKAKDISAKVQEKSQPYVESANKAAEAVSGSTKKALEAGKEKLSNFKDRWRKKDTPPEAPNPKAD